MKIEVGESLIRSWLRHVKGCQFAELNWKASPTWPTTDTPELEKLFASAVAMYADAFGRNTLGQLLKQAEVDVMGLEIGLEKPRVHLVDVAYHAGGLNYGSREKTKERIFKKLVRSALLGLRVFLGQPLDIYFVSPFVTRSHAAGVQEAFGLLDEWLVSTLDIRFHWISGEYFNTEILQPVMALNKNVADTSELFLRSLQLVQPFIDQRPALQNRTAEQPSKASRKYKSNTPEAKYQLLVVALYLAKFGHHSLGYGNQGETFDELGRRLGQNRNSIKNQRDYFDSFVDNTRAGWGEQLTQDQQRVFDDFINIEEADLRLLVTSFLIPNSR